MNILTKCELIVKEKIMAFLSTKIMILYLSKIVHTERLGWICLSVLTFKIQIELLTEEKKMCNTTNGT